MAATPARIGFILNEFRRAVSENAEVKALFGDDARQSEDPIPSYFDNVADARAIANERQALMAPGRRRFKVTAKAIDELTAMDLSGGVPVARYVDTERDVDTPVLVSEIVLDFSRQTATMTVWG